MVQGVLFAFGGSQLYMVKGVLFAFGGSQLYMVQGVLFAFGGNNVYCEYCFINVQCLLHVSAILCLILLLCLNACVEFVQRHLFSFQTFCQSRPRRS